VIVKHAVDGRASDIHIEPIEESYRVRFRVDGILHASLVLPIEVGRAIVSHIKILSNLKIDEKRKPQDGRFRFEDAGKVIDLRVSTLPVVEGEKVVMRILDKSKGLADLNTLGLMGRNYDILTRKIKEPFGIILMTGPTGSGKSTSLYAFLKILNQEERNIVTLEDPVEYFLEGINQSQIKPEIGYTFAQGLRSILRQDPNVIMVGEIRDMETAELAIHAALTGHLVFSTLHTNTAIGAVPRLVDMGIEPFLLASSLQVVAAQRLVRKICEHCKTEAALPQKVLEGIKAALGSVSQEEGERYGVNLSAPFQFFQGKGCKECDNTGYRGRIAIHEALEVTDKIQAIITEKKGAEVEVEKEALRQGMTTMRQDGLLKALSGITSLAEVERVTEGGIMVDEE
jgi:type IV pilus assembly protein PilB